MLDLIITNARWWWCWSSRPRRNNPARRRQRRRSNPLYNAVLLTIGVLVATQQNRTIRHLLVFVHNPVRVSGIGDASVLILEERYVNNSNNFWNSHAEVNFIAAERRDRMSLVVATHETKEIAVAKAYATDATTVIRTVVEIRNENDLSETERVAISTGVARFPNGTLGYIADPTALRRGVANHIQRMLLRHHTGGRVNQSGTADHRYYDVSISTLLDHYWAILDVYASEYSYQQVTVLRRDQLIDNVTVPFSDVVISADTVCADAPGMGMEGGVGAYQLLTHKIKVHEGSFVNNHHPPMPRPIKVLCAIYTHVPRQFTLVRSAALTWGATCDGFVAFANETIPELGLVDLVQVGPQAYSNMWQKTRSIWRYLYLHYLDEYDYFHLSGDDVYIIVSNLRHFLQKQHERLQEEQATLHPELYAGQWVRQKHRPYLGGGPGYTLSRATLRRFMESGVWHTCQTNTAVSYEDRLLSQCLSKLLKQPSTVDFWVDTREVRTGAQQYLGSPQHVYEGRPPDPKRPRRASFYSRLVAYWESLPYPRCSHNEMTCRSLFEDNQTTSPLSVQATDTPNQPIWMPVQPNQTAVGPRYGLDAAGTYAVAFHQIRHPLFQSRIHALLHPQLCSDDTALGKARRPNDGTVVAP